MLQVWSSRDFKPVKTLSGHEAKVTSVDVVGGNFQFTEAKYRSLTFFNSSLLIEQKKIIMPNTVSEIAY